MRLKTRLLLLSTAIACTAAPAFASDATWTSSVTGDWFTANDWSPAVVPNGPSANASLFDSTGTYSVSIQSGKSVTLNNLIVIASTASLVVTSNATLSVANTTNLQSGMIILQANGTLTANVFGAGTLDLNGGVLNATNLHSNAVVDASFGASTITNGLNIAANASLSFVHDLGTIDLSDFPKLAFKGNQTLSGNGTVFFDEPSISLMYASAGNLTIAPTITITTRNGSGTLGSPANGTVINQGNITVTSGRSITLDGNWTNQGSLNLNGGTIYLGGTFTPANIGTINRTSGNITIVGTMNNANNTFAPTYDTHMTTFNGAPIATISSGIIQPAGAALISDDGLLTDLTIAGPVTANYMQIRNVNFTSTGVIHVPGRLDVGIGTIPGDVQNITGSGLIHLENGSIHDYNAFVNLGANMTIQADSGTNYMTFGNGFTNYGTITANGANTSLAIQDNFTSTYFAFPWQNLGHLIAANGAKLTLFGEIPSGGLGSFDSTAGTISIGQKLFNDNNNLVLDGVKNVLTITGTLSGGIVTGQNGAYLIANGGYFQNVTLNANVTMPASTFFQMDANTTLGAGNFFYLHDGSVLEPITAISGNGSYLFDSLFGSNILPIILPNTSNLTIGNGLTIRTDTGSGSVGASGGSGSHYFNNGFLFSDMNGRTLTIGGNPTLDTVTNNNLFRASNSGSLVVKGAFTNNASVLAQTSAFLTFSNTTSNAGNISIQNASATFTNIISNTGNITIQNSTVTIAGVPANNLGNFSMDGGTLYFGNPTYTLAYIRGLAISNTTILFASGTLDNSNSTIPLAENTNLYGLDSGTISGGHILSVSNLSLQVTNNGTLANVTLDTDVTLNAFATLHLTGNTNSTHAFSLGKLATLEVAPTSLTTPGSTVTFDGGTNAPTLRAPSGQNLTIASGVTIKTGNSGGIIGTAAFSTNIQGTVIDDNGSIRFNGRVRNDGTITLTQDASVGPVSNATTSNYSLTNDANLSLSPNADFNIYAPFTQSSTGILDITVAGNGPELAGELTAYSLALNGTLQIHFAPGYTPSPLDSYTLLAATTSITGNFSTMILPALPPDLFWSVTRTTNSFILTAAPEPSSILLLTAPALVLLKRRRIRR